MGEVVWAASMLTMAVGGLMFRALPPDRNAAAMGLATGVGLVVFVVTVVAWHVHVGNLG